MHDGAYLVLVAMLDKVLKVRIARIQFDVDRRGATLLVGQLILNFFDEFVRFYILLLILYFHIHLPLVVEGAVSLREMVTSHKLD